MINFFQIFIWTRAHLQNLFLCVMFISCPSHSYWIFVLLMSVLECFLSNSKLMNIASIFEATLLQIIVIFFFYLGAFNPITGQPYAQSPEAQVCKKNCVCTLYICNIMICVLKITCRYLPV